MASCPEKAAVSPLASPLRGLSFIQYLLGPRGDGECSRVDRYWDVYALRLLAIDMADVNAYLSSGCCGSLVGGTA